MKPGGDIAGAVILGVLCVVFVVAFISLIMYIEDNIGRSRVEVLRERWQFRYKFLRTTSIGGPANPATIYNSYMTPKGIFAAAGSGIGAVVCVCCAVYLGIR